LRKSIRESAKKEVAILKDIGTSQMENEIQQRVIKITKNLVGKSEEIMDNTGISPSLGEEEINEYLELVVKEITKDKQTS
jgi:hypothetical protein